MEIIKKISDILSTMSEESQNSIIKKCEEFGFDINRGEITLAESLYNLTQAKEMLDDAIEKEKLNQLPITIQKKILNILESINSAFTGLISGIDEVVNIVNFIEQLYVALWQYNIHNISDEHLGYLKKMNQMKYQITRVKGLEKELDEGIKLKAKLSKVLEDYEAKASEIQAILTNSIRDNSAIVNNLEKTTEINQKISAIAATIEQNEKTVKDLVSTSKTSDSEIKAIENRLKTFSIEIDEYKDSITETTETAKKAVVTNNEETNKLITDLKTLENQIKEQIEKATGYSLFHSFQTRQESINGSKAKWLYAIGILVIFTLSLTAYIAYSHAAYDVAFYLKLSMSIPLIFAISFCTIQYSRERKLEEEYAFKSNISISLIPYKELVEKLSTTPEERTKYTTFLIDSITKVFTSPTEKIFDSEKGGNSDKSLRHLGKTLETIMKPIEPILKAMGNK